MMHFLYPSMKGTGQCPQVPCELAASYLEGHIEKADIRTTLCVLARSRQQREQSSLAAEQLSCPPPAEDAQEHRFEPIHDGSVNEACRKHSKA